MHCASMAASRVLRIIRVSTRYMLCQSIVQMNEVVDHYWMIIGQQTDSLRQTRQTHEKDPGYELHSLNAITLD